MSGAGLRRIAGWTLAAVFLAWVVFTFHWRAIGQVLLHTNLLVFGVASAATLPLFFLSRTLRWQLLLPDQARSRGLLDRYLMVGAAVGLAALVPLQGAEILKVESGHADSGLARRRGYSALLIERGLDLGVILAIFWICYPAYLPPGGRKAAALLLAFALLAGLGALGLGRIPGTGRLAAWGALFRDLLHTPGRTLAILAVTAAGWLLVLAGWAGVLAALDVHLPLAGLLAFMTGIALVGVFSLIPGGLGICELGITGMLVLAGVDPARAQGVAILLRCYSLVSAALGIILAIWRRRRLPGGGPAAP